MEGYQNTKESVNFSLVFTSVTMYQWDNSATQQLIQQLMLCIIPLSAQHCSEADTGCAVCGRITEDEKSKRVKKKKHCMDEQRMGELMVGDGWMDMLMDEWLGTDGWAGHQKE